MLWKGTFKHETGTKRKLQLVMQLNSCNRWNSDVCIGKIINSTSERFKPLTLTRGCRDQDASRCRFVSIVMPSSSILDNALKQFPRLLSAALVPDHASYQRDEKSVITQRVAYRRKTGRKEKKKSTRRSLSIAIVSAAEESVTDGPATMNLPPDLKRSSVSCDSLPCHT